MPQLRDIEAILEKNHETFLTVMQHHGLYSEKVKLYRAVKNVFSDVYGRESGEEGVHLVAEIDSLVVGDSFFAGDTSSSGTFEQGWLFTTSNQVMVGDLADLYREKDGTRRYKVSALHKVGSTRTVFKKYRLSALGD